MNFEYSLSLVRKQWEADYILNDLLSPSKCPQCVDPTAGKKVHDVKRV